MPFRQEVAPVTPTRRRDHHHARALAHPEPGLGWVIVPLTLLLTALAAAALPAQGLGSLQAQARVVATQPVQEALVVVRAMVWPVAGDALGPRSRRTRLALVRMDARPASGTDSRPRVVTVSFIRN